MATPGGSSGEVAEELARLTSEVARLRLVVADLEHEAGRSFLGYGPFETTAFVVAFFVTVYQLLPDPTGEQGAANACELDVYRQWRTAMMCLVGYVAFVAVVVVQQLLDGWTGRDLWWLLALMLAPWAPVAAVVFRTVTSARRVRAMMRTRGCRNRLTAVLREFLFLGHGSLSVAAVSSWLRPVPLPGLPTVPLDVAPKQYAADVQYTVSSIIHKAHMLPLSVEAMAEGPQLDAHVGAPLRWICTVVRADPLARWWSRHSAYTMPVVGRTNDDEAEPNRCRRVLGPCTRRVNARGGEQTLVLSPFHPRHGKLSHLEETMVLDVIDAVLPSGTLSDRRLAFLNRLLCGHCSMAVRAAVEAFAESSNRQHAGVRASLWFKDITVIWTPSFRRVLDVMRHGALVDNSGALVEGDPTDGNPSSQDDAGYAPLSAMQATDQVMTLLFFLSRSLLGGSTVLAPLREHLWRRLHSHESGDWWATYWASLRAQLGRSTAWQQSMKLATRQDDIGRLMDAALRDTVDAEVRGVLQLLLDGERCDWSGEPRPRLCQSARCFLSENLAQAVFWVRPRIREPSCQPAGGRAARNPPQQCAGVRPGAPAGKDSSDSPV